MVMPMMGFLFFLFIAGIWNAIMLILLSFIKPLRFLRRIVACFVLIPIFSSFVSFCLSWGLSIGLEEIFSSSIGGIGFFGGYLLGLLIGACLGFYISYRISPFKFPNLFSK